MVRQALQEQNPMVTLQITVNSNNNFFIFVVLFDKVNKRFDILQCERMNQYASFGVLGYRAAMDPDAFPIGYVVDERHEFLEARRVGQQERIDTGGDDEIRVFEGVVRLRAGLERNLNGAGDGLTDFRYSVQIDLYHIS